MAVERTHDDPYLLRSASPPWRIVQTKNLHGRSMATWLAKVESELGWETYYPLVSELRPLPRRRLSYAQRVSHAQILRPRQVPFLPQKVFVRPIAGWRRPVAVDLSTPSEYPLSARHKRVDSLTDYEHVVGWVSFGEAPAQISDELISNLRRRQDASGDGVIPGATRAELIFKRGERVVMKDGPFFGFSATVEKLPDCSLSDIDEETRLRLCIDIFGRQTIADVPVDHVGKIS
jgi:transcription antitermination factor NusG